MVALSHLEKRATGKGRTLLLPLHLVLSLSCGCSPPVLKIENEGKTSMATPQKIVALRANVFSLALDDHRLLWVGTSNGVYKVDLRKQNATDLVPTKQRDTVYSVFLHGDHIIASSWDKRVVRLERKTGKVMDVYTATCESGVTESVLTGDEKLIAVCTSDTPGNCIILSATSLKREREIGGVKSAFVSIAASPVCDEVALGDQAGTVRIYCASDGKCLVTHALAKEVSVDSIAYTPDGKRLAVGLANGRVVLIDSKRKHIQLPSIHRGGVNSLCFSPSGNAIVVGFGDAGINSTRSDNYVAYWDLKNGSRTNVAVPGEGIVQSCIFTPDSRQFLVGTSGGRIAVFDLDDLSK